MASEFELITVGGEIRHAHTVAHCAGRIGNHQMRMGAESTAESLSSESEKKQKTAHPTMDNANVTDVEEEDANSARQRRKSLQHALRSSEMLFNEFLKEHRTVQAQQKEIDSLKQELKNQRHSLTK